jgi:N-acetylglutamate synthase-like GNAT family acetyltransferase
VSEITLRAPADDDWPAILALAELSLAELPDPPSQHEWLTNRRSFSSSDGIQRHFVARSGERIVGYASIEHRDKTADGKKCVDGVYRLFLVVAPSARTTLGSRLLAKLRESLLDLGARRAWVLEYEADVGLISYLKEVGFVKSASYKLEDGGHPVVEMTIDAPFLSLVQSNRPR